MKSHDRSYDCIVLGGGHNGLVTAAYLAKAGKKVAILEKNEIIGGCTSTDETSFKGYKFSTASYVMSLFQLEIIKDLKLEGRGLKILPRNPSSFTPDLDGPGLVLGNLPNGYEISEEEINRYSTKDASQFKNYESHLTNISKKLERIIERPAPNLSHLKNDKKNFSNVGDLLNFLPTILQMNSLGKEMPEALELLTGAATPILNRWFESDILKSTLATDAIIGAMTSPSQEGSAYVLFHHVMGEAGGARGVWGYVRGGMGGLINSLEDVCNEFGVDIFTETEAENILSNNNCVVGIGTSNGFFGAPVIASTLDPNVTFNYLVGSKKLPTEFMKQIEAIDYSSGSMKINLALDRLPKFISGVKRDFNFMTGTIHIPNTMEAIERAFDDAKYGYPSTNPILEITIPSTIDSTLAPRRKHVMNIFVQYAPYKLNKNLGGARGWDIFKNTFADCCMDIIEHHSPGFKDSILYREVISPLDLERRFGLTGGNIFQGSMNLSNMLFARPAIGYADHTTPLRGLYLAGAGAHPGGGVTGIPGKNAAIRILKDGLFKRRKFIY